MSAQGLDAQSNEDQMEKSDGGATSPLQHLVMRCRDALWAASIALLVLSGIILAQLSLIVIFVAAMGLFFWLFIVCKSAAIIIALVVLAFGLYMDNLRYGCS